MTRSRVQRIDGGEDGLGGDVARQNGGGVQVGERGRRRRVGQVIGGHVNGLDRGDRTILGRGDALLQNAHFLGQRRLIAHGRRHTAEQSGHLRASLSEAEDVVDEQQHVLVLLVSEVLSNGKTSKTDTGAGTWGLVHLSVHEGGL